MNPTQSCRWLILIPTPFEQSIAKAYRPSLFDREDVVTGICGFGQIAAGIMSARLIAEHQPEQAILFGIAGSYVPQHPIGSAVWFSDVVCHGVGIGEGPSFQSITSIGWPQLERPGNDADIGDRLKLDSPHGELRSLLSTTSASSDQAEADRRKVNYPGAIAEDMEGFAFALACELGKVPKRSIVRGISNFVGDRDKKNWRVEAALEAAVVQVDRLVSDHAN